MVGALDNPQGELSRRQSLAAYTSLSGAGLPAPVKRGPQSLTEASFREQATLLRERHVPRSALSALKKEEVALRKEPQNLQNNLQNRQTRESRQRAAQVRARQIQTQDVSRTQQLDQTRSSINQRVVNDTQGLSELQKTDLKDDKLQQKLNSQVSGSEQIALNSLDSREFNSTASGSIAAVNVSALQQSSNGGGTRAPLINANASATGSGFTPLNLSAGSVTASMPTTVEAQNKVRGGVSREETAARIARLLDSEEIRSSTIKGRDEQLNFMRSLADGTTFIDSAKDFDLETIFAFRQLANQKNVRRKINIYDGFTLLSQMISFWIMSKDALRRFQELLLEKGLDPNIEVPSFIDGGFILEFVETYEMAMQMSGGLSPEDLKTLCKLASEIDMEEIKTKSERIKADLERDLGKSLELNHYEKSGYVLPQTIY
jgi:hypothetical protein